MTIVLNVVWKEHSNRQHCENLNNYFLRFLTQNVHFTKPEIRNEIICVKNMFSLIGINAVINGYFEFVQINLSITSHSTEIVSFNIFFLNIIKKYFDKDNT